YIIFDKNYIEDDEQKFVVKKGIEYSIEFLSQDNIWINLKYTNFCRTIKSIEYLNIQEPINHNYHKLRNIKTGCPIPKKVKYLSDIRDADLVFDTFDTEKAFQEKCDNIRFSQRKFWFEQTNLEQTVSLIEYLNKFTNYQNKVVNLERVNEINLKYKIILKKRKYLFGDGELHHTPGKGLKNAGVYRMPDNLNIKLLVSTQKMTSEGLDKIINNINQRLEFLYNDSVSPISQADIIEFDYHNFNEDLLSKYFQDNSYRYIVHLIKDKNENIRHINKNIIDILHRNYCKFYIINTFEIHTLANSMLKLGLYNKAIPWKIDCIDIKDKNHIFIGIDLGHNQQDNSTILTLIAIDNHGCLLKSYRNKKLPLNETIPYGELVKGFQHILSASLNQDIHITIHRDGKFQENIDFYHQVISDLGIEKQNYNLVEVTKSGVPLIGFYSIIQDETTYLEGFSGYYLFLRDTSKTNQKNEISYLITNDQCKKKSNCSDPS
ncbi:MAG: hypothetical protein WBA41_16715, partial [Rivularia sp. (in: cyanobacteria)]